MSVYVVQLEAVIRCDVTCCDCGNTVVSEAFRIKSDGIEPGDIQRFIEDRNAGNHFPVGWAVYGWGTYRCPSCKL